MVTRDSRGGLGVRSVLGLILLGLALGASAAEPGERAYSIPLTVTSDLPYRNTPMDPTVDFGGIIAEAGLPGVLDPNSIAVLYAATREEAPCAVTEDFAYGDKGRVEWVIEDPAHKEYVIRFRTAKTRPALRPANYTPRIGVGDLLRYNAGAPRPIAVAYLSRLVDLTGDGKRDLVGCWNYAYRPGWPWDGIICYPRVGEVEEFRFGDLARLRYVAEAGSIDYKHFSTVYMQADLADFNRDGLVDVVFSPRHGDAIHFYLNKGRRDAGGWPVFVAAGRLKRPGGAWGPCRAVDLDGDGAVDFVIGAVYSDKPSRAFYVRNANPDGWPIEPGEAVDLGTAQGPCFLDVDGDGRLDAIGLAERPDGGVQEYSVVWQRNQGGAPPAFGEQQSIDAVDTFRPSSLAAVPDGPRRGLLVLHDLYQVVSFYELVSHEPPYFEGQQRALSDSAVMALSDQAWPCACDWDGDGDLDLLVGGGYGWPRIVINEGTTERPAYAGPQFILSESRPIRLLRNDLLGEPHHWHNMGYPYPAYVDWDADGLPDLVIPNETNRIFWYKNVGTRNEPKFGPCRQVLVDGYPDGPEARKRSAELAIDATYPLEEKRPFFWRTGAGFADWTGDGLMDLVTHDGHTRKLTLFTQYRDEAGELHLKKAGPLEMTDGRLIDDAVVGRSKHWTESFKCVDWDRDGVPDIVYSCAGTEWAKGSIYLLRNAGTNTEPAFENARTLCCFGTPIKVTDHGPNPWVGDMDGDGTPDVLTCVEWSVYPFYRHAAIEMPQRPTFELGPVAVE